MTFIITLLSFCVVAAGVGPCSGASAVQQEALTPEPPAGAERPRTLPQHQTPTTQAFMREHASEALDMRWAVMAGRFDQLHRAAAIVADDSWSPHLRPHYLSHVTAVRSAASAALNARSMVAAGAALGELGAACASCHRDKGGPPQPTPAQALPQGVGSKQGSPRRGRAGPVGGVYDAVGRELEARRGAPGGGAGARQRQR